MAKIDFAFFRWEKVTISYFDRAGAIIIRILRSVDFSFFLDKKRNKKVKEKIMLMPLA
jgi:hypothetical protein